MQPVEVALPHTEEWYAARSTGIGASEIAAAAGLSPYSTPLELYHRKRGELPEIEPSEPMILGNLLEPVVKARFCQVEGITFANPSPPMFRHGVHQPITATPDAIIDAVTLFEAKTASWRMKGSWGDQNSDDVPPHYLCQCQQQMAVMNAAAVRLAVLFDGAELKRFTVLRNDELITLLISAALELWERIQNGDPPPPDWSHPSTPKLIREIHSSIEDARIELSPDETAAWEQYEELGRMVRDTEAHRDELKARVLHAIGGNFAGLLPDGRMVRRKLIEKEPYTVTPKPYIDARAVKADDGRIVPRETPRRIEV